MFCLTSRLFPFRFNICHCLRELPNGERYQGHQNEENHLSQQCCVSTWTSTSPSSSLSSVLSVLWVRLREYGRLLPPSGENKTYNGRKCHRHIHETTKLLCCFLFPRQGFLLVSATAPHLLGRGVDRMILVSPTVMMPARTIIRMIHDHCDC